MSTEQQINLKFLVQLKETPSEALGMLQHSYRDCAHLFSSGTRGSEGRWLQSRKAFNEHDWRYYQSRWCNCSNNCKWAGYQPRQRQKDYDVVLRHTLPVFTGLGRCPIVNWDFAGAVSIFGPDALPVGHQWLLPGLELATSRVRVAAHNH